MKRFAVLIASVIPIAVGTATSTIELDSNATIEPIAWPKRPRPSIQLGSIETQEDGPIETRTAFISAHFTLVSENAPNWEPAKSAQARYSLYLQDKGAPDLTLAISVFAKDEFLSDLSEGQWIRYVAYVENQPEQPRSITFQHDSQVKRAAPILLDKRYRQLEYEFINREGAPRKTRELFTFIGNELVVFSLNGPKEDIERLRQRHNLFFTRMNRLD